MKNFIIVILSFAVVFTALQVLSGMFLTWIYTPDLSSAWQNAEASHQIGFGNSSIIPTLISGILAVSIAYFMPSLFRKLFKMSA